MKGPTDQAVLQLTAWVPIVPATRGNGCMQVIKHGHRAGTEVEHLCCTGGSWYVQIKDGELTRIGADDPEDIVTCEVAPGDVLFLQNIVPHRSLDNLSSGVRWSIDLRWQRTSDPAGFYDLKDCIKMVDPTDPDFKFSWAGWAEDDRQVKQTEAVKGDATVQEAVAASGDPFDTVIAGPWMGRWPIIHHNRHVDRYLKNKEEGVGTDWHAQAKGGAFG